MPSEPTFYRKPTYITDCEEYISYHCFVTENKTSSRMCTLVKC